LERYALISRQFRQDVAAADPRNRRQGFLPVYGVRRLKVIRITLHISYGGDPFWLRAQKRARRYIRQRCAGASVRAVFANIAACVIGGTPGQSDATIDIEKKAQADLESTD